MPNLTSMSATVGALLKERQQTIAVTESSCGGLISASLVAVPGCSAFYVGGPPSIPVPPSTVSFMWLSLRLKVFSPVPNRML